MEWYQSILYSLLSVTILSAVGLLNLAILPLFKLSQDKIRIILNLLVAISIGSLLGDVFFHLIPQMYKDSARLSIKQTVMETMVLIGIWVFFVFEKLLQHYHHGHGHGEGHNHGHCDEHFSDSSPPLRSPDEEEVQGLFVPSESTVSIDQALHATKKPIGFLLLFSDLLHNLVDGLAIGISFSASTDIGISTSIAILFHEIPHELGDYIILISSGFPKVKAFMYSLATNMSGFVGALLGVGLNEAEGIRPWIIAFTAGNFLYLSLADLIPELLHAHSHGHKSKFSWILQNAGMVIGATLMFLIKIFE